MQVHTPHCVPDIIFGSKRALWGVPSALPEATLSVLKGGYHHFGARMVGRKFHVMHILCVKLQTEKELGLVWEINESSRPAA